MNRWVRVISAGAVAGAIASAAFLVLHAMVIVPLWQGIISGTAMTMATGAIISCGFYTLAVRQARFADGLYLGVLLWAALVPATLTSAVLHERVPEAVEITIGVTATALYGALVGVRLGKRFTALLVGAGVALVFFVRAGGPLIHVEHRRAVLMFAGLLPVTVLFGIAQVIALRVMLLHSRRS